MSWVDDNLSAIAAYVYLEEQHQTGNREVQTANQTHRLLRRIAVAPSAVELLNPQVDWSVVASGEVLEHE